MTKKIGNVANIPSRHLYSIEYDAKDGTLTPLQGQPIIDLYRSLSIGGIVAFIGSGTSTLLGYENWDALAEKLLELAKKKLDPDRSGDRLSKAIEDATEAGALGESPDGFDKYDSLALATEMLRQTSANGEDSDRSGTLRELFSFPASRTVEEAKEALLALKCSQKFEGHADAMLAEIDALGVRGYLPIDYIRGIDLVKAIVGVLSSAAAAHYSISANETANASSLLVETSQKTRLLDTPSPSIDVLGTLRKDWKITRYATLNYDHEIERMLERTDFPFESITHSFLQSPLPEQNEVDKDARRGPKLSASSRLGEKARSVDLDRSNVAEFMLFGADSPAGVSQVLHLHGSARNPAQMIVTDIDYNRRYFLSSSWNQVLEDSQELLYRGNAIVFIGVGMSEDVLFRAMRILSQVPEREMRPVYAFMASKGDAKDTADGIKLFQRYGIRTIFYGSRLDVSTDREAGDFNRHPLVEAVVHAGRPMNAEAEMIEITEEEREIIAKSLSPLSVELLFLKSIQRLLENVKKAERKQRTSTIKRGLAGLKEDVEKILGKQVEMDAFPQCLNLTDFPRLTLTQWHSDVFRLVWTTLGAKDSRGRSLLRVDAIRDSLRQAVSTLTSAIHSRALQDALQAISTKSIDWRKRWRDRPQDDRSRRAWHFREAANAIFHRCEGRVCSHNISQPHSFEDRNRRLLRAILADESGKDQYLKASILLSGHKLVVTRARSGTGKGILASGFSEASCPTGKRLVVSFGQSCGRDSIFDLLAYQIALYDVSDSNAYLELIVSRVDIVMTNSEKRPKLAEWDVFFEKAINHPRTRMLVLCENEETVDYFREIAVVQELAESKEGAQESDYFSRFSRNSLAPMSMLKLPDFERVVPTKKYSWSFATDRKRFDVTTTEVIKMGWFTVWDRDSGESFRPELPKIESDGLFPMARGPPYLRDCEDRQNL